MSWPDRVRHVPFAHPAVDALLRDLRETHAGGGALFVAFEVDPEPPDQIQWYFGGRGVSDVKLKAFLLSDAVRQALPALRLDGGLATKPDFGYSSSFTLDGELTQALVVAGAYKRCSGPPGEAKRRAMAVTDALYGTRYTDVHVFRSGTSWSLWFCGVAWDATWVAVDDAARRAFLLCVTDTD